MPERGILSSAMLSGIPEVDLGTEAKMKNIEQAEQARIDFINGKIKRKKPILGVKQADGNLNYGRARFMIGGGTKYHQTDERRNEQR